MNRLLDWLTPRPLYEGEGAGGGGADTVAGSGADTVAGSGADTVAGSGADTVAGSGAGEGNKNKTSMQRAGEGVADPGVVAKFPDNWREQMSLGADGKVDPKRLETAKRYATPSALGQALHDAQGKIRSGKAADDVPMPDATKEPEKAKAWRAERGIPDTAEGYALPEAVTKAITDADKPVLADFTGFAHKKNASPAAVAVAAEWYTDFNARMQVQQATADKQASGACDDVLREELGKDFKPLMNAAGRYANELFGVEGADVLTMARFPNTPDVPEAIRGKRIGDVPGVMKGFIQAGLDKYGDVTFIGQESADKTKSRLEEIKQIMNTKWDEYAGNPKMQQEYQELLAKADKNRAAKAA